MELNNIQLTPQMLAGLYPHVLVESASNTVPEEESISYLGDNNKNILVLVNEPSAKYLPEKQLNFLVSVITACQLSLADTAIVNTAGKQIDYAGITGKLQAKVVLLFDVPPTDIQLPMEFPFFQVQKFRDETYVYAPSLAEVEKDVPMKKQLWVALKKAFGI